MFSKFYGRVSVWICSFRSLVSTEDNFAIYLTHNKICAFSKVICDKMVKQIMSEVELATLTTFSMLITSTLSAHVCERINLKTRLAIMQLRPRKSMKS